MNKCLNNASPNSGVRSCRSEGVDKCAVAVAMSAARRASAALHAYFLNARSSDMCMAAQGQSATDDDQTARVQARQSQTGHKQTPEADPFKGQSQIGHC
jgi:hypothetical protein